MRTRKASPNTGKSRPQVVADLIDIPPFLRDAEGWSAWERSLEDGKRDIHDFQQVLKRLEEALHTAFERGVNAEELVQGRAAIIDRLLARAWRSFGLEARGDTDLLAVGGYGRGQLHPGSDIDLLLLLSDPPGAELTEAVTAFLTFLWDIGLEVGHSVRTVADCVAEAEQDITVITNLMEARLLAGNPERFVRLEADLAPAKIWDSKAFFQAKLREQNSRHHKFGDSAYKVEPNLKDGPGGLRDIQTISWVTQRHFGTNSLRELRDQHFLTEEEYAALVSGQSFLWEVRFTLHQIAGRKEDRLLFDYQRALANHFGYTDANQNLAVEQFMQHYYRTVMELERLNEMLLQLLSEVILTEETANEPVMINRRFRAVRGYLEPINSQLFAYYPPAMLELFLLLEQHPELKGVTASTIRLVRSHLHLIDERFRNDLACRTLFMEILRQPEGITHALRRMNRYGVLAQYLPSFGSIVGRMQYDLYHAYTVDEHTLFVVRNMRRLALPKYAHEVPLAHEVFKQLPKPELLYLAGLFHDIAKGRGGDHSELGAVDAETFCLHHGLSRNDAQLVAWLVRRHLVMSMTAQRKDISDPEILNEFARLVGSKTRLDYLYTLTIADIRGTNPNLWNSWKDSLFSELYNATKRLLRRGLDQPLDEVERIEEIKGEARELLGLRNISSELYERIWAGLEDDYFLRHSADEIAWHTQALAEAGPDSVPLVVLRPLTARGSTEIFIYAELHPQLFAVTTAVLDQLRLDIVDARIMSSTSGRALNTFLVLDHHGNPIDDQYQLTEIAETLRARLQHPGDAPPTVHLHTPRRLKQFKVPTRIAFNQDRDHRWTILELRAGDRPGLLSSIGRAFADCDVNVASAKIATVSEEADDVFFVTEMDLSPITDPARQEKIRQAIEAAV